MNVFKTTTLTKPTADELHTLFQQTTWAADRTLGDIEAMIARLDVFVCIRQEGKLVGFARALTDGVYRAHLDDIVVDAQVRGAGLGRSLVDSLLKQLSRVEEVFLNAGEELVPFYSRSGFKLFEGRTMVLARSQSSDA
ncbi:GNAT family N-acetyltransferase [Halomonas sp. MCCC 1A17488]|uniref:GNAT family N-acetyltransferase n=1 Tax=unclassified Halomonas TaxID=2609666 RepID=UPI0018D1F773|nr:MULTISPECIES: GNAT family N-acetyltransferase [unclassified Halomonas]MCE8015528.1 GNAT family N-acetyltransferase [Halomonas sp. MCCC 1A17488]MCG3238861.1 GNAT family N-acetyltransferase [Halomonas sp. MCCC 1A17488]QPP51178.1 GNAT family N-acetyltransferase [Halomonas sp. SS10-MC5]